MLHVKYNGQNVYNVAGVRLLPGVNTIENEKLAKAFLEHPHVVLKMKRNFIEKIDANKAQSAETNAADNGLDISKLTAKDIIAIVKTSEDRAFLEGLADHKAKTVVDAAADRLNDLDEESEEESDEENEGDDE